MENGYKNGDISLKNMKLNEHESNGIPKIKPVFYDKELKNENLNLIRPDLRSSYGKSTNLAFNEKVKNMIKSGENVCHLAFGESPFPVPECLQKALGEFAHAHEYLPVAGLPELRRSIADFHQVYDGLELDMDNIIVAPGSKELLYLMMAIFNGDVIIPSPAWVTYEPQAKLAMKKPIIISSDESLGWKMTPLILNSYFERENPPHSPKLLILTNPGNPTGTCYTESELKDLSIYCREKGIIVISDEIYARLTFNRKHHSLAKYYPEGTILISGFSKWASAGGWRVGYAHFPSELRSLFKVVLTAASHTYSCAPAPMQHAVAKALRNNKDELADYASKCCKILDIIFNYCYKELSSVGVIGHRSEGGFYYIADFEVIREGLKKRHILTGPQMTEAMLTEAKIALMPLLNFLRSETELSTRLCFVCFDGKAVLQTISQTESEIGPITDRNHLEKIILSHPGCQNLISGVDRLKNWVRLHHK